MTKQAENSNKKVLMAFRCTESEMDTYRNVAALYAEGNVSRLIRDALIAHTTKLLNRTGKRKVRKTKKR